MKPREFICEDCKQNVISFDAQVVANDDDVCMTCSWLRNIESDVDREGLRRFLEKTGSI